MTALARSLLLAAALAAPGCTADVTLTDSIDLSWDFVTLESFDDELHSPYVRGATMRLHVYSNDDDESFVGWTITSSDPAVFRVDDLATASDSLDARGTAVGEGVATLTVRDDDGDVVGHGLAEVLVPDRVELEAHGYLILGHDADAAVGDPTMIANGTATFLVRYFHGDRELHGNGVLATEVAGGVTAEARTSYLFEDREWLTLRTGADPGAAAVTLFADGVAIATREVTIVPETAIADVDLLAQSDRGHDDGDWLVLLAQAYDAAGTRVFGIDFLWDVDGEGQDDAGDLYRYELTRGAHRMVTARKAGRSASVMIQSANGYVDSSNEVGCSAASPRSLVPGLALIALGLLARRRRLARG